MIFECLHWLYTHSLLLLPLQIAIGCPHTPHSQLYSVVDFLQSCSSPSPLHWSYVHVLYMASTPRVGAAPVKDRRDDKTVEVSISIVFIGSRTRSYVMWPSRWDPDLYGVDRTRTLSLILLSSFIDISMLHRSVFSPYLCTALPFNDFILFLSSISHSHCTGMTRASARGAGKVRVFDNINEWTDSHLLYSEAKNIFRTSTQISLFFEASRDKLSMKSHQFWLLRRLRMLALLTLLRTEVVRQRLAAKNFYYPLKNSGLSK